MISRVKNTAINSQKGQTALEYALVAVVIAMIASLMWVIAQEGLVDQAFYGSYTKDVRTMGLDGVISRPYP